VSAQLTKVVLEKRPLNGCSSSSSVVVLTRREDSYVHTCIVVCDCLFSVSTELPKGVSVSSDKLRDEGNVNICIFLLSLTALIAKKIYGIVTG